MFVGHLAVALAAKRLRPATPLTWFMVAANLVDLAWPLFLLAGLEHVRIAPGATAFTPLVFESYPWTHSLLMAALWGGAFAALARAMGVRRDALWLIALVVMSHWVLDLVTHAPDLPLWPGAGTGYGLGLWNSVAGTFIVEGALWAAAIALFLRVRRPAGWQGQLALWSFVTVSTAIWASGVSSPPPPDERALALFALVGWIILPWAWWIERTSSPRGVGQG